jgi:hypothetical protein
MGWLDENRWIVQKMVENLADSTSSLFICRYFDKLWKKLANQKLHFIQIHFTLIGDPLLKSILQESNLYVYPDETYYVNNNNSK